LTADPALAGRVEAEASRLVAASLAYMPGDAFWEDRYGERGRRFAYEDGAFHLQYLRDALRAGSQSVLDNYGRWLRDVLVARGMCTRHLQQHFEHLGSALDEVIGDPGPGAAMRQAAASLAYPAGDAAAVQAAAGGIAIAGVPSGHSGWDPEFLVHYAADAMTRNDPATLASHLSWARGAFARAHADAPRFDALVSAVIAALRTRGLESGAAMIEQGRAAGGSPPA